MSGANKDLHTINPDAGGHRIPSDPAELEASLRAGQRCWDEFPYYAHRYGERGHRFALSDAAWLATLADYDDKGLRAQVEWLARVLASRGMPSTLLERQLVLLRMELAAAIPDRSPTFDRLILAAGFLHRTQGLYLDDATFNALASALDARATHCGPNAITHCGPIVVGAVVDELAGRAHALDSVEHWLTDPTRFSSDWIASVRQAIAETHTAARKP